MEMAHGIQKWQPNCPRLGPKFNHAILNCLYGKHVRSSKNSDQNIENGCLIYDMVSVSVSVVTAYFVTGLPKIRYGNPKLKMVAVLMSFKFDTLKMSGDQNIKNGSPKSNMVAVSNSSGSKTMQ